MLSPESTGSDRLREFILKQGLNVWFCHNQSLARMFELMVQYADQPMDLADASIVAAAEDLKTQQVFTIDRRDFETYRIRRGHHHIYFEIVS